jgi:hypothetical protein
MVRKLLQKIHVEVPHGGVIHRTPEPWRGGSERSHALAVLDEFLEPAFQPSHENLMRVHEALIHVVKALVEHAALPTS